MILLKLAFRNLLRQKRRSLLTLFTMVIGFFFLSLSIGLSKGSYTKIIEVFTSQKTGHIQIHFEDYLEKPGLYKTLDDSIFKKLNGISFIKASAPRIYSSALAFSNEKALGIEIIGIDTSREFKTTNLDKMISKGEFTDEGVVITYSLSKALRLDIGDDLVLISQGADGSVSNDIFVVSGITGTEKNNKEPMVCYLDIKNIQEFLALDGRFHEVAIVTDTFANAPKYAKQLNEILNISHLDIQPWQKVEESFYNAMQADIKGMWYSLAVVMFIVAIGVLNTILMSLLERTREYGIMKALGTSPVLIFMQILIEIFLLTILAIFVGAIISFIAHLFLSTYGIPLPTPFEYGGMTFTLYQSILSFDTYYIPAILILAVAMIISIYPAITSAMKKPIEAIRYV